MRRAAAEEEPGAALAVVQLEAQAEPRAALEIWVGIWGARALRGAPR